MSQAIVAVLSAFAMLLAAAGAPAEDTKLVNPTMQEQQGYALFPL